MGLVLLLPLALVRGIGMGDLKFATASGAFLGPWSLLTVLMVSVFVNGLMALVLAAYKRRLGETFHNIGRMLASLAHLHLPGPEFSIDNPSTLKVPYGVALAFAIVIYVVAATRGAA